MPQDGLQNLVGGPVFVSGTLLSGSLSVSNFINALLDSSVEAWVNMPDWQNLLADVNNKIWIIGVW